MPKSAAPRRRAKLGSVSHPGGQGKGRCLRILRALSAFIDDELSENICQEIRRHLGDCPNCEDFVTSLRQTVWLCRHRPVPALSSAERASMRAQILRAALPRLLCLLALTTPPKLPRRSMNCRITSIFAEYTMASSVIFVSDYGAKAKMLHDLPEVRRWFDVVPESNEEVWRYLLHSDLLKAVLYAAPMFWLILASADEQQG